MGCCCAAVLVKAMTPSGRLPATAVPVPNSDPMVAKMIETLQGEWRIVPINFNGMEKKDTGYRTTVAFQNVTVTGTQYVISGGNATRVATYFFEFSKDPNDPNGTLYCDKWGSIIKSIDAEKGEVMINNGFNMDLRWKRPDSWYQEKTAKKQLEMQQQQLAQMQQMNAALMAQQAAMNAAPPTYNAAAPAPEAATTDQ